MSSPTATNVMVSASLENDDAKQNNSKRSRRLTLEINFKKLGRAIANGKQKKSHFYNDVGVVIDKAVLEVKDVGESTSTAPKDKAATLPATTNVTVPKSSEKEDGRRWKSRNSRHHTLVFGLIGKAVKKGSQQPVSQFFTDGRNDIDDKLKQEEDVQSAESMDQPTADPAVVTVPASSEIEVGCRRKTRKTRRHTVGLFGRAVTIGRPETSHFYHDYSDDVDKVKRLES